MISSCTRTIAMCILQTAYGGEKIQYVMSDLRSVRGMFKHAYVALCILYSLSKPQSCAQSLSMSMCYGHCVSELGVRSFGYRRNAMQDTRPGHMILRVLSRARPRTEETIATP